MADLSEPTVKNELLHKGRVEWLCINGVPRETVHFRIDGPDGDNHSGFVRKLSGHDGAYIKTSSLIKGDQVFNWRNWTGLSLEELREIESKLGLCVPKGCLLENLTVSGIPGFTKLAPSTRLVFPKREQGQPILAVWEENTPCVGVGRRLASHYGDPDLSQALIRSAVGKRGVMGFVLSSGYVSVGDDVLVYPGVR